MNTMTNPVVLFTMPVVWRNEFYNVFQYSKLVNKSLMVTKWCLVIITVQFNTNEVHRSLIYCQHDHTFNTVLHSIQSR